MRMEPEKCLEIMFPSNAQIEPTLLGRGGSAQKSFFFSWQRNPEFWVTNKQAKGHLLLKSRLKQLRESRKLCKKFKSWNLSGKSIIKMYVFFPPAKLHYLLLFCNRLSWSHTTTNIGYWKGTISTDLTTNYFICNVALKKLEDTHRN